MGYIHDFDVKLSEMLSELPEERRRAVVSYVKSVVIESYQNGIATGRLTKGVTGDRKAERADTPHE